MKRHQNHGLRKLCLHPRRQWATCPDPWHFNFKWHDDAYRFSLERCVGRLVCRTTKHGRAVWGRDLTSLGAWITDKTAARVEADRLKVEIQKGRLGEAAAEPSGELTLRDVAKKYLARHVHVPTRRAHAGHVIELDVERLCGARVPGAGDTTIALGDKPIAAVTKADVEAVRDQMRAAYARNVQALAAWRAYAALPPDEQRLIKAAPAKPPKTMRAGVKQGEVAINRLVVSRLRALFSWAIQEGYTKETPFRRHGVTMIKAERKAETPRIRRLEPGEEEALRAAAEPHLRALIVAELSTGCRKGELLSLQWRQIRHDEHGQPKYIVLGADNTKTNESRIIPIGASLRAELEMRRTDPAGALHGPDAHVFGNELGHPIKSVHTAWLGTCRRAKVRGLHFHDLRREFACRLLESGAGLHDVREFLGHANITTTSRYLKSSLSRLELVLARMETTPRLDEHSGSVATPVANEPDSKTVN